ncbi:hypothetical protein KSP40_PGU010098 [Platanthera guangdongensis]|uniref:Uncharacterized protein n=1 Tax=Platanthera guangdongensis TaxID=2320717 RepID=A0ABR2M331_9ASPA
MPHHPNSLLDARTQLGSAMFLLADFERDPVEIANIKKDIIAPYNHVVNSIGNESATFEARPLLAFFQVAIVRKDVSYFIEYTFILLSFWHQSFFYVFIIITEYISNIESIFCLNTF